MFYHIWMKYKLCEVNALEDGTKLTDNDRLFIGDLICSGEQVTLAENKC